MPSYSASVTASGDTTLIAAPSVGFIRVHAFDITNQTALNEIQIKDGGGNVKIRCNSVVNTGSGMAKSYCQDGYFDCAALTSLVTNLSATGVVGVNVTYSIQGAP